MSFERLIGGDVVDVVEGNITEGVIIEVDDQLYRVRSTHLDVKKVSQIDVEKKSGNGD